MAGLAATALRPALADPLDPPSRKVEAVLDSDTYNEIDDQFAVAYAFRSTARMDVKAIYAAPFFNERSKSAADGMSKSYDEILRLLERLKIGNRDFAFRGSETFLSGPAKPVDSPAARDLLAKAKTRGDSGPLYVVTIGAATNVASALLLDPSIRNNIVVVWLGGQPYDWTTADEFNLRGDIHASRILYDSGVPLVNIPATNVSEHLRTSEVEITRFLGGKSPVASYLADEFSKYMRERSPKPNFPYSKVIWDISAVAWLNEPKWIETRLAPSPVLTDDFRYEIKPGRHNVRVAIHADRDPIFNDLFTKLTI